MPSEAMPRILRGSIVNCGQARADRRDRNRLPGRHVGRGGDDRERTIAAGLDARDRETVGIRMLFHLENRADDDAGNARAAHDLFDRKSEHCQTRRDRFGVAGHVDELT